MPGGVFSLAETKKCLKQVIEGIDEVHKLRHLHRDIKPAHILARVENGEKVYKLAGFGFAMKDDIRTTVLGCDPFIGPEVFKAGVGEQPGEAEHSYSFEADMWSFGVLMFIMLNRSFPFSKPQSTQK